MTMTMTMTWPRFQICGGLVKGFSKIKKKINITIKKKNLLTIFYFDDIFFVNI